jgi:hypothetical protein
MRILNYQMSHDIAEILLKVALNTIKQIGFVCLFYTDTLQE